MDFSDFLKGQEEIYQKFRDKSKLVETDGVKPWKTNSTGGYLVVFRPHVKVANILAAFSEQIAKTVPSVVYSPQLIHTTISDYGVAPLEEFTPDSGVLERMCNAVNRVVNCIRSATVNIRGILYNQDTVITEGQPDNAFFDAAMTVIESCKTEGIDLRYPWGSHSTISRIYEGRTPQQLNEFLKLMRNPPNLNQDITFNEINIASFKSHPDQIQHNYYRRFQLR